ncbi:MAG TPA: hypothetical protein VGF76_06745, partial [Polyangiaceae bacterium]
MGDDAAQSRAGSGTTADSGGSGTGSDTSGGSPSASAGSSTAGAAGSTVVGTGGATGSSGSTGSSAGSTGADCPTIDPTDLISDFETGTAQVVAMNGRGGDWFLFNDGSGTQTPTKVTNMPLAAELGGACSSQYAFHTSAMNFTVFGAGLGADFAPKAPMATDSTPYDASMYTGIALQAKAGNPLTLRVSVSDANTAPEGKVCVDTTDKTNKMRCGDYFGADASVTAQWQDFVLPFATMSQRGFGLPIPTGIVS